MQQQPAQPKDALASVLSVVTTPEELRSTRPPVLRAGASFMALRLDVTTADVLKVADR